VLQYNPREVDALETGSLSFHLPNTIESARLRQLPARLARMFCHILTSLSDQFKSMDNRETKVASRFKWIRSICLVAAVAAYSVSAGYGTSEAQNGSGSYQPPLIGPIGVEDPCMNPCEIYGVDPTRGIYSINVCTGFTVTLLVPAVPAGTGPVNAAVGGPNSLLVAGFTGPVTRINLGSGAATAAGALGAGAGTHNSLSEVGGAWYSGTSAAELFRKAALQGIGAVRYTGDLAWNLTCDAQTPLYGMTGAVGAPSTFVSVNRANGAQTIIGAVGAAGIDIFGLAYDGFGTLWGTSSNGQIGPVNTATGAWTAGPFLNLGGAQVTPFDLASTPRCLSCDSAMLGDLGDAPDSTNHYATSAMTAYPAVSANFPTVFDEATGVPVGPMHWFPKQDHWLGVDVSTEADADLLPDNDGLTNIDPTMDLANRDFYDDGLLSPISLPNCQLTSIQYSVRIVSAATIRYVNAWIDFNRDGDWADSMTCIDPVTGLTETVDEWVVQDHVYSNGPGTWTLTSPTFRSLDTDEPMWMRLTATDVPATGTDGSGPESGFEYGETEDYLLMPNLEHGSTEYFAR
jgi:hypothetical protein